MGKEANQRISWTPNLKIFECILENAEEDEFRPEGDDLVALQSLEAACNRLVELEEISGVNVAAPEILERIRRVMEKPEDSDEGN